jgi:hypothetical protein
MFECGHWASENDPIRRRPGDGCPDHQRDRSAAEGPASDKREMAKKLEQELLG